MEQTNHLLDRPTVFKVHIVVGKKIDLMKLLQQN